MSDGECQTMLVYQRNTLIQLLLKTGHSDWRADENVFLLHCDLVTHLQSYYSIQEIA